MENQVEKPQQGLLVCEDFNQSCTIEPVWRGHGWLPPSPRPLLAPRGRGVLEPVCPGLGGQVTCLSSQFVIQWCPVHLEAWYQLCWKSSHHGNPHMLQVEALFVFESWVIRTPLHWVRYWYHCPCFPWKLGVAAVAESRWVSTCPPGLFCINSLRKMSFDLGLEQCFLPLATQWN